MSFPAIVLAAGASRRLGQSKQLLKHGSETLLKRAIRLSNEAGASPVFAVLGAHFEIISASVPLHDATIVFNGNWEQGIASSIHAGLRALNGNPTGTSGSQASGALLLTCDQPRLTAAHLRALTETFTAQSAPSIVASTYAGVLGVPAMFPRTVFPELLALHGDKGARELLKQPSCPLVAVEFAGGEVDIDIPADLEALD
jgi:CTP:molybdopterin cytidylyltransferase MocA